MIKVQLSDADRKEVVKYRLEKANRTYQEAIGSIKNGYVETAANRLYYAAYYAVSALLISYKYEVSTHNGVIQMFGKVFLRNNIIDKKYGKIFNQLFSDRQHVKFLHSACRHADAVAHQHIEFQSCPSADSCQS